MTSRELFQQLTRCTVSLVSVVRVHPEILFPPEVQATAASPPLNLLSQGGGVEYTEVNDISQTLTAGRNPGVGRRNGTRGCNVRKVTIDLYDNHKISRRR